MMEMKRAVSIIFTSTRADFQLLTEATFSACCRKSEMVRDVQTRRLNPGCKLLLRAANLDIKISFSTPLKLSTTCRQRISSVPFFDVLA
jgi:hypothetical protein